MRAKQEWFSGRIASVYLPDGQVVRLTSIEENYLTFELHWKSWTYYDPVTVLVARELCRKAGTLYDVGANIGYFSLVGAKTLPGRSVVSFEPNPKLFRILQRNLEINGMNATCEPLALSDITSTQDFYIPKSDMSGTLEPEFQALREGSVQVSRVPTTTLDKYVSEHPPRLPLVVKIDVEGHEPKVLTGAAETLRLCRPNLIVEVTSPYSDATMSLLRAAGYGFYAITHEGLVPCETLLPYIRGRFAHPNYLLSPAPATEVAQLFERLRPAVERLDLEDTTLVALGSALVNAGSPAQGSEADSGPEGTAT